MHARGLQALLIALLVASCASPPADEGEATPARPYVDSANELESVPAGDGPWRAALAAAMQEDRLGDLLALCRRLADEHAERWEPAWTAGECLLRLREGDPQAPYEAALSRAEALRDPVGIACSANRLGALAYWSGDNPGALLSYDRALAAAVQAGRRDLEAFVRNNLAGLLVETGEYGRARDQVDHARLAFDELGMADAALTARLNGAVVSVEMGNAAAAADVLETAREEAIERDNQVVLDTATLLLGNLALARRHGEAAERWFRQLGDRTDELGAIGLFGSGRLALLRGQPEQAAELLERAAAAAGETYRRHALIAESFLGDAERRLGRIDAARARLERVIEESDELKMEHPAWAARWSLGRLLLAEGKTQEAVGVLTEATARVSAQRAALDPLGGGMTFLRDRAEPYVDLACALAGSATRRLGAAEADALLAVAREAKARALRHVLAPAPAEITASVIQRALSPGDVLLEILLGEDSGLAVAYRPNEIRVASIDGSLALAADLAAYRAALSDPGMEGAALSPEALSAGRRLREAILDPLLGSLDTVDRLFFVPDRELALLPIAALPLAASAQVGSGDRPRYVGDRVATALLPMAAPPDVDPATPRGRILLGGAPTPGVDGEYAELPWAAFELSSIRDLWGDDGVTLLAGESFTVSAVTELPLARYGTIHLATHAVASTLDPQRCGVIFDGGERMGIDEISELRLDSPLVVLSGCRTGEGEVLPGEGIVGLGWAFLGAGARAIVVSHWSVDDVASARLTVAMHRRLRGGADPMQALAAARRELSASHAHPYHWAPFVLVVRPARR